MTTSPTTDASAPEVLEVSVHIAAEPSTIFPFFTDPQRYAQWMGTQATLDPRPGGEYRAWMREGLEASGTFVELDPPHRIEFTWGWLHDPEVSPGSTRVVITLEPDDAGTLVRLRHHNLPSSEQCDHHRMGWELYLSRLSQTVDGVDVGPDPNATIPPS